MTQWEYCKVEILTSTDDIKHLSSYLKEKLPDPVCVAYINGDVHSWDRSLMKLFNDLGMQGWELISYDPPTITYDVTTGSSYILKRPIEP